MHNFWDRGLLGIALAPNFPADPYVYVAVHARREHRRHRPALGRPGVTSDGCPTPPGATTDGCVVSGRLSRLQALTATSMTGTEQVLIEDWCQQFPSHSVGALEFGADGALYVSRRRRGELHFMDYGQDGTRRTRAAIRRARAGSTLTPPTAEGGALRCQDVAHDRPIRVAWTAPDPRSIRRRAPDVPDNPLARELRPERAADHRPRLPQPVPLHVPAGHERGLGRRRRLEHLGGDRPARQPDRRRRRQLRVALLRGPRPASRATTRPT